MGPIQQKLIRHRAVIATLLSVGLIVVAGDAIAANTATMGDVASNILTSFTTLGKLITATAYLAGLGFAVGAIIKFNAHKDQPAQIPIGQPIGLLMVAAALLFLPTILGVTGKTMFGTGGYSTAGPQGTNIGTNI